VGWLCHRCGDGVGEVRTVGEDVEPYGDGKEDEDEDLLNGDTRHIDLDADVHKSISKLIAITREFLRNNYDLLLAVLRIDHHSPSSLDQKSTTQFVR